MAASLIINAVKRSVFLVEELPNGVFELGIEAKRVFEDRTDRANGFFTRDEMITIRDAINLQLGE